MAQVNNDVAIHINLDKNNQLAVSVNKATAPDAIQLCLAAIGAVAKITLEKAAHDPKLQAAIKQDLFDMINLGASNLLAVHFPEISLRPDVTVEAIAEIENKKLTDPKKSKKLVEAYVESEEAELDREIRKEAEEVIKAATAPKGTKKK